MESHKPANEIVEILASNYISDNEYTLEEASEDSKAVIPVEIKKDKTESKYVCYALLESIEYGERGPQGNRTSFIPMGELVFCTQCGPEHAVKLRTKGQRCPIHNKELKKLTNSKSENLL